MRTYNEENAQNFIESLIKNGRRNLILTDDLSSVKFGRAGMPSIACFLIEDGCLLLGNEYGEICSIDELKAINNFLTYTIENFDEEKSIKNEIKSLYDEIEEYRKPKEKTETPKKSGYVYLMKGENGRYKIGMSKDPKRRQKELCLSSCEEHTLVYFFYSKNPSKDEKNLHNKFKSSNSHSEWFDLSEEDVNYIKSIKGDEK